MACSLARRHDRAVLMARCATVATCASAQSA
jgi:hypothetical protein